VLAQVSQVLNRVTAVSAGSLTAWSIHDYGMTSTRP